MMKLLSFVFLCFLSFFVSPLPDRAFPFSFSITHNWEYAGSPWVHGIANRKKQTRPPTFVRVVNLRYHQHATYTRLVLDLQSSARYSDTENKSNTKAHIQLKHAVLSQAVRAKLAQKKFPMGVHISELPKQGIQLVLNLKQIKKYKAYFLTKPHRFVLDLYYFSNNKSKATFNAPNFSSPVITKPNPNPQKQLKDMLVVLDPGHGGKDPGAIGRKGTQEKRVTLNIATRLRSILKKRLETHVFLTREKDQFLSLEDRVDFANQKKADLFVSIHVNSHPQKTVHGLEVYHFGKASDPRALAVAARENGTPLEKGAPAWQFILADKLNDQKIDESRNFAWTTRKLLVKTLKKYYPINDHGVKTAPFYVLRFTTMPSILAEVAFVSNPIEEKRLRDSSFQQKMAEGIFSGIKAYLLSKISS